MLSPRRPLLTLLFSCLTLLGAACGGNMNGDLGDSSSDNFLGDGTGENSETLGSEVSAESIALGDSISFSLNSENNGEISFSGVTGDEEFLLVISNAGSGSSDFSFSLSNENTAQALTAKSEADEEIASRDFHDYMREIENTLPAPSESERIQMDEKALTVESTNIATGSTREFSVLNSLGSVSSCTTVTARAVLVTDTFILYLDNRLDDLSDAELDSYTDLDSVISEVTTIAGDPGDMDGNGKIAAVITPVVNGISTTGGGVVTGFFTAIDLFSNDRYSCSNEGEAVYLVAPDPDRDWSDIAISRSFWLSNFQSTFQHEVQHLTNYHQRVFENNANAEASWLNEALSHLMEDLNTSSGFNNIGPENPSRVERFLESPESTNMTSGTALAQRGESYLFLRYLFEQADAGNLTNASNGRTLISNLIQSTETGTANVEAATGISFAELFRRFSLAIAISGRDFTDDSRYNFDLFNFYSQSFDDNRGTTWNGPSESDFSEGSFEASPSSIAFITLSGNDVLRNDNQITINGGSGEDVYAHLVRVQ